MLGDERVGEEYESEGFNVQARPNALVGRGLRYKETLEGRLAYYH
jgi:hypothetical protein